jgi:hypothetical protein
LGNIISGDSFILLALWCSLVICPKQEKCFILLDIKFVRVNIDNGVINEFASNKGKRNGPASWLKKSELEWPVSVKFDKRAPLFMLSILAF